MSKPPKPAPYHFHPLEVSVLGYSGSGKTTLIERLIDDLRPFWNLAYVKHDAHSIEVDTVGKDTFRAKQAGAQSAFISNEQKFAWMSSGKLSMFQQKSLFLESDAVIVEGYKTLDIDKIVVLDSAAAVLDVIPETTLPRIIAFVGAEVLPPRSLPIARPYFHRDDHEGIAALLQTHWHTKLRERPLHGLVLAGGLSSRMGRDKSLLPYEGRPQALRALDLLQSLEIPAFLSLRAEQWSEEARASLPIITDQFLGLGPFSGILSAMQSAPNAAWLVLACDLPLLQSPVVKHLIAMRQPQKLATAYRSVSDGLPEPLCAIYEPAMRMRLLEALGLGLSCPRKVLLNTASVILDPIDSLALTNVNTPDDYRTLIQTHNFTDDLRETFL
ncbi:MAG: molybdopterin-guanine dinucleotide biosynthesis protein B [Chitinophagaceae bacterium]|nr:molybdopterin-guanine dinucleotide biosynthesis protein B [Oligoflexus sp.]